jgi:hypothetical protein
MAPPLIVHSDAGLVVNDRWEKQPLSLEDLKKIKPFLERIKVLKQLGLTGFSIVASFLYHRVQPLKARERYGFEYVRVEDSQELVSLEQLLFFLACGELGPFVEYVSRPVP